MNIILSFYCSGYERRHFFYLVIRKLCSLLAYIKTNDTDEEFDLLRRNFAALNLNYKVKFFEDTTAQLSKWKN